VAAISRTGVMTRLRLAQHPEAGVRMAIISGFLKEALDVKI